MKQGGSKESAGAQAKGARDGARRSQQSRTEATRAALIDAGRRYFGQAGYYDTRTEDLVKVASVTRGALYHHFADKAGLFEAVARQVATELTEASSRIALNEPTGTWQRFMVSMQSYLRMVAEDRETQQILLIDGPAVLGWLRWRAIQSEIMLPSTVYAMELLIEAGTIRPGEAEPLAHIFLAALHDAALMIAHAPDGRRTSVQATAALLQFVAGLAPGGGSAAG